MWVCVLVAYADCPRVIHDEHRSPVSVVGFDDTAFAARMQPALTTVRQDAHAKGQGAAAMVLVAIEGARVGEAPPIEQVVLPVALVVRDSTRRAGHEQSWPTGSNRSRIARVASLPANDTKP